MMYNTAPEYLVSLLPLTVGDRTEYNLRNADDLDVPFAGSRSAYNSFIIRGARLWTNLPTHLQTIPKIEKFKYELIKNKPESNKLFYLGNRRDNVILSKLRMNCSELKSHLYNLKIITDKSCICGYVNEHPVHFFFDCPLYSEPRRRLHEKIIQKSTFTLRTLLYGDNTLSYEDNIDIITNTIEYIKETKRFL